MKCKQCNKETGRQFCNLKCFGKYRISKKVDCVCLTCGKVTKRVPSKITKYCSRECIPKNLSKFRLRKFGKTMETEEQICKSCETSIANNTEYNFLCDECAKCIMKRNDEWDVNNYLDTDLQ